MLPFYAWIVTDRNGLVWIQDPWLPAGTKGPPRDYTVFDRDGGLIGRVEIPRLSSSGVSISWIGPDRVLLGWRDEDLAPHLTLHALHR